MRLLAGILCSVSVLTCLSACGNQQGGGAADSTNVSGGQDGEGGEGGDNDSGSAGIDYGNLTEVKTGTVSPSMFYQNMLAGKGEYSTADPMILKHGDTYYLYYTGGTTLTVRSSTDLKNWENKKTIFQLSQTTWGVDRCWAPEVHEYNGKFYLFFCGRDANQIFHGGIAVCDTPDGTFEPISDEPILNFPYSVIDLSFFVDDDGRTYIYYSKDCSTNKINGKGVSQSYGVEVSNDLKTLLCEPVLISTPTEAWETKSGSTIWNEGPVVFKQNGTYYLLYSANYYQSADYAVGYCTSDSPLKLFDKPKSGRILQGNGSTITGAGHCNILRVEDEIYLTYHTHTTPPNTDNGRSLCIDKLVVNPDGTLYANGPTNTKQPLPDGINGYYKYHGDIEITGNLSSNQDLGILYDEMIPKGLANHIVIQDGEVIKFTFPEAQEFDLMWIYQTTLESNGVASVDVVINGQYVYKDFKFASSGVPAIINFSKLPKGTKIETVEFSFKKAEGSDGSAIGEITFVYREQ